MKRFLRNKWALVLMGIIPMIIAALAITTTSISGGQPFKLSSPTPSKQAITVTPVTDESIDSGLFNKEGCKAPCWHDLTPGQSTSQDVDDFLLALPKTQWPERNIYEYVTGCKSIRLVEEPGIGIVDLYVVDNNLTFIQSFRSDKTRLEEIVKFFGDPEYFKAVLYIGFDYYVYTLEVYYPHKGVAFEIATDPDKDISWSSADIFRELPDQKKINEKIDANMVVSAIHYFEPGDLSSYYLSRYFCTLNKTDAILRGQTETKFTQKWHGFGEIDVLIDSELQSE